MTPEGVHGRHATGLVAHEEAGAAAVRRCRADDAVRMARTEEERNRRLLLQFGTQLGEHFRPVDHEQ